MTAVRSTSVRTGAGNIRSGKCPQPAGQPAQITKEGGFGGVESTDGTLFYYAKSPNKSIGIWSVPAWGGEEIEIDGRLRSWPDFTVSEKGIYFSSTEPAPFAVQSYDFRTRPDKRGPDSDHTDRDPASRWPRGRSGCCLRRDSSREATWLWSVTSP